MQGGDRLTLRFEAVAAACFIMQARRYNPALQSIYVTRWRQLTITRAPKAVQLYIVRLSMYALSGDVLCCVRCHSACRHLCISTARHHTQTRSSNFHPLCISSLIRRRVVVWWVKGGTSGSLCRLGGRRGKRTWGETGRGVCASLRRFGDSGRGEGEWRVWREEHDGRTDGREKRRSDAGCSA